MRHVPTCREYVDHAAVCERYTAEHLTVFLALAEAVDSLRADPYNNVADLSALSERQRSQAMGILLALVTNHEIQQAHREGVCP